ncbi:MAG: V-type ATP synthase subunit E [Methanomicrobiales archaeon]
MMGVDQIIARIRMDAEKQIETIHRHAGEEVATIIRNAEKEGMEEYTRIMKEKQREISQMTARIRSQAALEAQQMVRSEKEMAINETFSRAREQLAGFRDREAYTRSLEEILSRSVDAFEAEEITVIPAEEDREIVESLVAGMRDDGVPIRVGSECTLTRGGVILKSPGGRMVIDQTFEARMNRKRQELFRRIAGILFGEA